MTRPSGLPARPGHSHTPVEARPGPLARIRPSGRGGSDPGVAGWTPRPPSRSGRRATVGSGPADDGGRRPGRPGSSAPVGDRRPRHPGGPGQTRPAGRSRIGPADLARDGAPDQAGRRPPPGFALARPGRRPVGTDRPDHPAGEAGSRRRRPPAGRRSPGPTQRNDSAGTRSPWGALARRGASSLRRSDEEWRGVPPSIARPHDPPPQPDVWVEVEDFRPGELPVGDAEPGRVVPGRPEVDTGARPPRSEESRRASSRARRDRVRSWPEPGDEGSATAVRRRRDESPIDDELAADLVDLLGPTIGKRSSARLARAVDAYRRDRYEEVLRILGDLERVLPDHPAVLELHGLALYRLGRWRAALRHLERHRTQTGAVEQLPVIADCHRALRHFDLAHEAIALLRQSSPGPDLLAEGRLVEAGCLADEGRLEEAIALLAPADRELRHPAERHVRQWYALADLYERAGQIPQARRLFRRVAAIDPELGYAAAREGGLA